MYCSRDMVFAVLSLFERYRFSGLVVSETELAYQNPIDLRMDVLLFDRWREVERANRLASQSVEVATLTK